MLWENMKYITLYNFAYMQLQISQWWNNRARCIRMFILDNVSFQFSSFSLRQPIILRSILRCKISMSFNIRFVIGKTMSPNIIAGFTQQTKNPIVSSKIHCDSIKHSYAYGKLPMLVACDDWILEFHVILQIMKSISPDIDGIPSDAKFEQIHRQFRRNQVVHCHRLPTEYVKF